MKNTVSILIHKAQWCLMATFLALLSNRGNAQLGTCPYVNAGADIHHCAAQPTTLTASYGAIYGTNSYSVASVPYNAPGYRTSGGPEFNPSGAVNIQIIIDDNWTGPISLPFTFCFFGNNYEECWIGSNGVLSFDDPMTSSNTWSITGPAPGASPPDLQNCIMGPWHDIDPSVTQTGQPKSLNLQVYGSAPCRAVVFSWFNIPMFSSPCNQDTSLNATHQIVLYESSNIVEIYIHNKQVCTSWNHGQAIEGIQGGLSPNLTFFGVPNRNATAGPSYNLWAVQDDAWRFTPNGNPLPATVTWLVGNTPIGSGNPITVNPTTTTTYTARVTYPGCGSGLVIEDQVTVHVGGGCITNSISMNTGLDIYTQTAGPVGSTDKRWHVPQFPTQYYLNPPAAYLIGAYNSWAPPSANSQWISAYPNTNYQANTPLVAPFIFQFCFCLCDSDTVNIDLDLRADDQAVIKLDNNVIGTTQAQYSFLAGNQTHVNMTTSILDAGQHCFTVEVWNLWGVAMGLNVAGRIMSPHLIQDSCCAQPGTAIGYVGPWATADPIGVTLTPSTFAGGYGVGCSGGSNGSISTTTTGGNPPYTYIWSNGSTASSIGSVVSGQYSVTISDSTGQSLDTTVVLTSPPAVLVTNQVTQPTCVGLANGAIDLSVSGGVQPYSYVWSNGATTQDVTGLAAGTYSVTISDANGCTAMSNMSLVSGNNINTLNLSTGRSADTQTLLSPPDTDPNWALLSADSVAQTPFNAFVIAPHSNWIPAPSGSQWIAHDPQSVPYPQPGGTYTYGRNFVVSQVDPGMQLELIFMADDSGTVSINGQPVISNVYPAYQYTSYALVPSSAFQLGNNHIEVKVGNKGQTPTGFVLSAVLTSCTGAQNVVGTEPARPSSLWSSLSIYPNPTNGMLHISGLPDGVRAQYTVTDTWGRVLLTSEKSDIDVHALAAGMYFLRVKAQSGETVVRFVKN
jgi:large repetitive protein